MDKTILIIGGTGLLGHSFAEHLSKSYKVISFSNIDVDNKNAVDGVEYIVGDVWDSERLSSILENVDVVIDCISMTMPNSNTKFLDDEIQKTVTYTNYIMNQIIKADVKGYIFPSSGGAIYGNSSAEAINENTPTNPCTPYGVGKKMCENILMYYSNAFNIDIYSLRIGNVYGSKMERDKAQCVIDLLIQKALKNECFEIWGDALDCVRDYVFLDDVADAVDIVVKNCLENKTKTFHLYNIGSGVGITLKELITIIENKMNYVFLTKALEKKSRGISSIVLSFNKIKNDLGWYPKTPLLNGIQKTIDFKKELYIKK